MGKFFVIEYYGVRLDIVMMGKGIGNGFFVSFILIDLEILRGKYGFIFGGNLFVCRVVVIMLRILRRDRFVEKVGEKFMEFLGERVVKIRGRGFMIGIVFRRFVGNYVKVF